MSGSERTLYQTMGVSPRAASGEIREAYLRLARTLHPDRYSDGSPGEKRLAERRMREVNAAWEVLGRPESRRDATTPSCRSRRVARRPPATASRPASARPASPRPASARPVVVDLDEDDVVLSPIAAFLLRRGPIIVLLFLALGLFVGTALADKRPREPARSTTSVVCANPSTCAPGGG